MKALLIIGIILIAGCSDEKKVKALKGFALNCNSKITAEIHYGEWNDYLTLSCDDWAKPAH